MKNIEELRVKLCDAFETLYDDPTRVKEARAIVKEADKALAAARKGLKRLKRRARE